MLNLRINLLSIAGFEYGDKFDFAKISDIDEFVITDPRLDNKFR